MKTDPFREYLIQAEPGRREKGYAWNTAIGLQAVDGLKPSQYLVDTAVQNIEGKITIEEAQYLVDSYYEERREKPKSGDRTEEADKVSARIAALLSENAFSFTPTEYLAIHKKLFTGIYSHAGKIRDYNITKKEWVLDGASVLYGSASELGEGNTRTTAVFFIKYLRTLGFDATNDIFAENAWYFRNALVRANYNDLKNGIHETTEYLEVFLRNLLLNEKNPLHNRMMHINKEFINLLNESLKTEEANIEMKKVNIKREKANIVTEKVNIDVHDRYSDEIHGFLEKTINHIQKMYDALSDKVAFGREDVQHATGLKPTRASMLIKELVKRKILEPVSGYGKGKYKFTGISVERQYGSWTELL